MDEIVGAGFAHRDGNEKSAFVFSIYILLHRSQSKIHSEAKYKNYGLSNSKFNNSIFDLNIFMPADVF